MDKRWRLRQLLQRFQYHSTRLWSSFTWFSLESNQATNPLLPNPRAYTNSGSSLWAPMGLKEVVTVDVHSASGLINKGYVYLDVRTVEEFEKGHVDAEKIFNIPYMFNTPEGRVKNPEFLKEVSAACNKEDHIIVCCQSGVRSLYATTDLLADGFKDVNNMVGGYLDWIKNEFAVKKPVKDESPLPVVEPVKNDFPAKEPVVVIVEL